MCRASVTGGEDVAARAAVYNALMQIVHLDAIIQQATTSTTNMQNATHLQLPKKFCSLHHGMAMAFLSCSLPLCQRGPLSPTLKEGLPHRYQP
mmetsp:Transcript_40696/g.90480  ORF Transcript_40696/g.90480 Transcript_40696/m.90480 type:complete len:93 (-) Transcript_40696:1341-1619(-)